MIEPIWPGTSRAPLTQVGPSCRASVRAVTPPSLMPSGLGPGQVESPSISSRPRPASATAARQASTVRESGSTMRRRPTRDWPTPVRATRSSYFRGEAMGRARTSRGRGSGPGPSAPGSGSNSGRCTSSWCSKRTRTRRPTRTSSGSQPTMLVVRRARSSSARATTATTYGGGKSGSQVWWLTLKPTTTAWPETEARATERPRQDGHTGSGGWKYRSQSAQCGVRSTPSAPEAQNSALGSVGWCSGRVVTAARRWSRWPCRRPRTWSGGRSGGSPGASGPAAGSSGWRRSRRAGGRRRSPRRAG